MSSQKLTDAEITERIGTGCWNLEAAESFVVIKQMQEQEE